MKIEKRIEELGYQLPQVSEPLGLYVPALRVDDILYLSATLPMLNSQNDYKGKIGKDLTIEQGFEAAKVCAFNALAVAKDYLGNLDEIDRIIKVVGYINSAQGFYDYPKVLNGASQVFISLFGDKGKHVRFAIGVADLVANSCILLDVVMSVKKSSQQKKP